MFAYTQPAFPAPKRTKHAPISFSRPHIITEVYNGGLKVVQLACEPASTCRKPCPFPQKGPKLPVCALYLVSRQGFSRPTPRRPAHLPISKRIWCLLTDSTSSDAIPLKTVWFVDSTGSTPPSTSGMSLTGHNTTGLLTVSSLPREAARAERKVPA